MGGGSAEKPKTTAAPPQAQPIDYGAIMAQSNKAAKEQYRDQLNAQVESYPKMERLQLGTISNLSSNLSGEGGTLYENKYIPGETTGKGKNKKTTEGRWEKVAIGEAAPNRYTQDADTARRAAASDTIKVTQSGDRIGTTATRADQLAGNAQAFAASPTALDQRIAQLGASAMSQRPDQVQGTTIAAPAPMQSARLGEVPNAQARQIAAQESGAFDRVSSRDIDPASTGQIERVQGVQMDAVAPIRSAQVARTRNVRSRGIRSSDAEETLMSEARGEGLLGQLEQQASNDLSLGRSLSAEQERDAVQSARAGMAARGLGTGNSALAAEMLNRDRFATQRENARRNFAGQVLNQGTGLRQVASDVEFRRLDTNAGRSLQAGLANQSVAANRSLTNAQLQQQAFLTDNQNAQQRAAQTAQLAQQANLSNQDFAFRAATQDAGFNQQAALANQDAAFRAQQLNQAAGIQSGQFNAQQRQAAALSNQDSGLRANLANQQTALSLGLTQGQFDQSARAANFDSANQRAFTEAGYSQQAALANQDANQRQVEANRAFLQNANQSGINSEITRGGYALGALGQSANLYGQQAGAYQNASALGLNIANQSMAIDPYMRALAPGTTIGSGTLGTSASMIGNTYNSATQMAGNVAGINATMLDSRYNTWANNNASLQSSYMQAKATDNASSMGLQGAAMGASAVIGAAAAACWIARAAFGTETARWVRYRRAMLHSASDRVLRLYCQHGQAIAARITTPLRRLLARITLRSMELAWS